MQTRNAKGRKKKMKKMTPGGKTHPEKKGI